MNDRPSAAELLEAVRHFLQEEVVPRLDGPRRYHARVAANVVSIVAREIESEEGHLTAEWERLGRLLERREPTPSQRVALREGVQARTEALVTRIRAGEADSGDFGAGCSII